MAHGLRLRGGRAEWYRSRFVLDAKAAEALGHAPIPGPGAGRRDGEVNTHFTTAAGKLYALVEAGKPAGRARRGPGERRPLGLRRHAGGRLRGASPVRSRDGVAARDRLRAGPARAVPHPRRGGPRRHRRADRPAADADDPRRRLHGLEHRRARPAGDLQPEAARTGRPLALGRAEGRPGRAPAARRRRGAAAMVRGPALLRLPLPQRLRRRRSDDRRRGPPPADVRGRAGGPNEGLPALARWTLDRSSGRLVEAILDERGPEFPRINGAFAGGPIVTDTPRSSSRASARRHRARRRTPTPGRPSSTTWSGESSEVHDYGPGRVTPSQSSSRAPTPSPRTTAGSCPTSTTPAAIGATS